MPKKNTNKTKASGEIKKASTKKSLAKAPNKNKITPDPLYMELFLAKLREEMLQGNYPSKIFSEPWIFANNKTIGYPSSTVRSGKWCVFVNKLEHDDWWMKIKQALNEGKLGKQIKTSTGWKSPLAVSDSKAVIIVFTYDYEDKVDAMRIRNELRQLGVTWKVAYKPDRATKEGKYSNRGDTKIGVYYE